MLLGASEIYQRDFEDQSVRKLIEAFNYSVDDRKRIIFDLREYSRTTRYDGEGYLTFSMFDRMLYDLGVVDFFPSLPVPIRLNTRAYGSDARQALTLPYLLRFERTFLVGDWLNEAIQQRDDFQRPYGMVFNMGGGGFFASAMVIIGSTNFGR